MRFARWVVLAVVVCVLFLCVGYTRGELVRLVVEVEATLIYNNSVGSDWNNTYSVIYYGDTYSCSKNDTFTILYRLGDELEIYTRIVEEDDSMPDKNSESFYASFSESDVCNGRATTWTHNLMVVENGGRYKGNTAEWEVEYTFYVVPPTPTPKPTASPTPKPTVKPTERPERTLPPSPSKTTTPKNIEAETTQTHSPAVTITNDGYITVSIVDAGLVLALVFLVGLAAYLIYAIALERKERDEKK